MPLLDSPHLRTPCAHAHQVAGCMRHRLFGPFRQNWCFPFEAYLLELKHLCEASNWLTVPYTVATKWSLARSLSRRLDMASHDILAVETQPASDFLTSRALVDATRTSPLLSALVTTPDHSTMQEARYLHSVSRDQTEVRCDDWILLASKGKQMIAHVCEMAEVRIQSGMCIRLWCDQRQAMGSISEDADGMIRIDKAQVSSTVKTRVLVRFEECSVTLLQCVDRGTHFEYRYQF